MKSLMSLLLCLLYMMLLPDMTGLLNFTPMEAETIPFCSRLLSVNVIATRTVAKESKMTLSSHRNQTSTLSPWSLVKTRMQAMHQS